MTTTAAAAKNTTTAITNTPLQTALAQTEEATPAEAAAAPGFPESHPAWELLGGLPIQLDVAVPLKNFRVRDLLALEEKMVIQSKWHGSVDVPLCSDGVQMCWTEFETVGQKIAVRLTMVG